MSRFDPLHGQRRRAAERLNARLDLCRPALALRVLVALQLTVALAAQPGSASAMDWSLRTVHLSFATLMASLLWLPTVCALGQRLQRWHGSLTAAVVCGLGAIAGLFGWSQAAVWGSQVWTASAIAWPAFSAATCGAALGGAVWTWLKLRAASGAPAEASARLAELQSRIRPHFLFNALNTALVLVRVDPALAEGVLEDLAQIFRAALAETSAAVTLDEEIELAQRYLAIEKLRYGERLHVTWDLDPAAAGALLPPLVLQPLVENAVRHGIEALPAGGRIVVRTLARRGMATVWVSNPVPDAGVEPGVSTGSGMALANVRERLRLLHDLAGTLEVWREPGQFHARIAVPLP